MIGNNRIIKGFHRTTDFLLKIMPFIIAMMMMTYGISRWYDCLFQMGTFKPLSFTDNWHTYLSSTIMIISGILMALFYRAPMTTLIGFFSIGIASNRLLSGLRMFFTKSVPDVDSGIADIVTAIMIVMAMVYIAIATNMIISSTFYLRGIARKRRGMLMSGILFLVLELSPIVFLLRTGTPFPEIVEMDRSTLARIALYITYIILLGTDEIRDRELMEHQSRALDGIRTTYLCDPFARIDRDVAVNVASLNGNWSLWKDKRGWGPVEYEYRFVIKNRNDHTFVTVQKWKDSDRLYFTAAKNHHGSLLDANRFAVDDIELDGTPQNCRNIRFFNNEGLYIQIPVRDKMENDLDDGSVQ